MTNTSLSPFKIRKFFTKATLLITLLSLPIFSCAKPQPLSFEDLVLASGLIVKVTVQELYTSDKHSPSKAKSKVLDIIKGSSSETLTFHWHGLAVTEMGEWLVFLKHDSDGRWVATHGSSSFWKLYQAENDNNTCCFGFYSLNNGVGLVSPGATLTRQVNVYFPGVPVEKNPIASNGFREDDILKKINLIIKGE